MRCLGEYCLLARRVYTLADPHASSVSMLLVHTVYQNGYVAIGTRCLTTAIRACAASVNIM